MTRVRFVGMNVPFVRLQTDSGLVHLVANVAVDLLFAMDVVVVFLEILSAVEFFILTATFALVGFDACFENNTKN